MFILVQLGVISLAKCYVEGREPSPEQKETVITEFSDWENHSDSLQLLFNADTHFRTKLGLEHREALHILGWNKVQVRDAVKELIGDEYRKLSRNDAKRILDNVYALNNSIKKAQGILCD